MEKHETRIWLGVIAVLVGILVCLSSIVSEITIRNVLMLIGTLATLYIARIAHKSYKILREEHDAALNTQLLPQRLKFCDELREFLPKVSYRFLAKEKATKPPPLYAFAGTDLEKTSQYLTTQSKILFGTNSTFIRFLDDVNKDDSAYALFNNNDTSKDTDKQEELKDVFNKYVPNKSIRYNIGELHKHEERFQKVCQILSTSQKMQDLEECIVSEFQRLNKIEIQENNEEEEEEDNENKNS